MINSREECVCPCCGSPLKYRDSRKRVHRIAGGGKEWYLIRRLKCSSDKCGRLHNELPDCLCPYKHYDAGLIEDVVDGVVSEEDTETEDYPCEGTMKHWRLWFQRNKKYGRADQGGGAPIPGSGWKVPEIQDFLTGRTEGTDKPRVA